MGPLSISSPSLIKPSLCCTWLHSRLEQTVFLNLYSNVISLYFKRLLLLDKYRKVKVLAIWLTKNFNYCFTKCQQRDRSAQLTPKIIGKQHDAVEREFGNRKFDLQTEIVLWNDHAILVGLSDIFVKWE